LGAHGKIFVSYRREDAPGDARSIYDRLGRSFGEGNVFMDVDQLLAGQRFDRELNKALAKCDVLIAVIGSRWMDLLSEHARHGKRDYVRDEIAAALQRDVIVIPVMMGREANMPPLPEAEDLPENIRDLVLYQKHNIAHESFGRDAAHLIAALQYLLRERRGPKPWRAIAVTGVIGLVLTGFLLGYWMGFIPRTEPSIAQSGAGTNVPKLALSSSDAEWKKAEEAIRRIDEPAPSTPQPGAGTNEPKLALSSSDAASKKVEEAIRKINEPDRTVADFATKTKTANDAAGVAEPALNIAGRWRDNRGIMYDIEQEGDAFRLSASGPSCSRDNYNFQNFQPSGRGTINGRHIESSYSSSFSEGQCSGTLLVNRTEMTLHCNDTVCGALSASLFKQ